MKRRATNGLQRGNVKRRRTQPKVVYMQPKGEKKGVDISIELSPVLDTTSTNGSSFVLNLIPPGNGSNNRVGRKVNLQSVRLRGTLIVASKAVVGTGDYRSNTCRMVVVYDKQPSGVLPTFDTIFGRITQDSTESCSYLDPVRYDNMSRFQVLRDTVVSVDTITENTQAGTNNSVAYPIQFDEYIKLAGRETVYGGQNSPCSIADISTGGLYVYFRADINAADTAYTVAPDSFARLRYID